MIGAVVVANISSAHSRREQLRELGGFDAIVVDECHRAATFPTIHSAAFTVSVFCVAKPERSLHWIRNSQRTICRPVERTGASTGNQVGHQGQLILRADTPTLEQLNENSSAFWIDSMSNLRTGTIYFALLALSVLTAMPGRAATDRGVALVIGNSAYRHASELRNPRNDAEDMAAAFEATGFKVLKGVDLDRSSMEQTIRRFARALKNAKTGIFFYAGHALQIDGRNYLVPIDARLEDSMGVDFELVRLGLVQRTMERSAKTNLIFLDACRNNPLARNLARAMGTCTAIPLTQYKETRFSLSTAFMTSARRGC